MKSAGFAAAAAGCGLPLWAEASAAQSDSAQTQSSAAPAATEASIQVRSSYGELRFAERPALAWSSGQARAANSIVIDARSARQEILGFGAALTDATCFLLNRMPEADRAPLMEEFFSRDRMNLSVCRTAIGASDYSRKAYTFDDAAEPDPELKHFSIDYDREATLPILQAARRINPALFLFSSPWSPPAWMKSSNSLLGGSMRKHWFEPYARYFVRFLEEYKAAGVQIDAVTVQNEVDTDQDGRMPACLWGQEYEVDFVANFLAPALRRANLATDIWILDHNYNLLGRAMAELAEPDLYNAVDGVAWHGYLGTPEAMTRLHEAYPAKHSHWSEGGPDLDDAGYLTDFARWAETFSGILNNWARSITAWNLVLDEKGAPNIGPFRCAGTVTLDSATGKATRSGQYWALAHFSQAIRRGARVLASNAINGPMAGLSHLAVRNPDGSHVLILANRGEERQVQVVLGERSVTVELEPESVHTLSWA